MRQAPFIRFGEILSDSQAVTAGVAYARKHITLSADDADRATIIEGLGAIAVVAACAVDRWSPPAAQSLSAAEGFVAAQDAAYDLIEEIVVVANAQLQPLLASGPKFQLPKRSGGGGGGGAMSMSMRDPVQEALDAAAPLVIAALPLVEFALTAGSFFAADKPAGKFFAYLWANKPAAAQDVESVLSSAIRSARK